MSYGKVICTDYQRDIYSILKSFTFNDLDNCWHLMDCIRGYQFKLTQACSWCGSVVGFTKCTIDNRDSVSHGICKDCVGKHFKKENI